MTPLPGCHPDIAFRRAAHQGTEFVPKGGRGGCPEGARVYRRAAGGCLGPAEHRQARFLPDAVCDTQPPEPAIRIQVFCRARACCALVKESDRAVGHHRAL
jgi:hypothetical protein